MRKDNPNPFQEIFAEIFHEQEKLSANDSELLSAQTATRKLMSLSREKQDEFFNATEEVINLFEKVWDDPSNLVRNYSLNFLLFGGTRTHLSVFKSYIQSDRNDATEPLAIHGLVSLRHDFALIQENIRKEKLPQIGSNSENV